MLNCSKLFNCGGQWSAETGIGETWTYLEILEAENVKNADRVERVQTLEADVQLGDNPLEQLRIQRHGQRVTRIRCLFVQQRKANL